MVDDRIYETWKQLIFYAHNEDDACLYSLDSTTVSRYIFRFSSDVRHLIGEGVLTDFDLAMGIRFVFMDGEYRQLFRDDTLDMELRVLLLRSIPRVYRNIFYPLCQSEMAHASDDAASISLANSCFMFWDCIPLPLAIRDLRQSSADSLSEALDLFALSMMEDILHLDHIACQESIIHGLGHWHLYYPDQTEQIIDEFLERIDPIHPLISYALRARRGDIH